MSAPFAASCLALAFLCSVLVAIRDGGADSYLVCVVILAALLAALARDV